MDDQQDTLLTSKQLLERSGISRATLNNYVAQGLLPKPVVKRPVEDDDRATRLGYFPLSSIDTISQISSLKKRGHSMNEIVTMLGDKNARRSGGNGNAEGGDGREATGQDRRSSERLPQTGLRLTLDQLEFPAYLVNTRFELEWANDKALSDVLGIDSKLSNEITKRNIFGILMQGDAIKSTENRTEILNLHMSIAKRRLSKSSFLALDAELDNQETETLSRMFEAIDPVAVDQIMHTQLYLELNGGEPQWFDVYTTIFREGFFFAYVPTTADNDTLLKLLARRDIVIRDLLKKRQPYLTPLGVLVADLQDSVKICAELPPEEYFELINDVWGAMEPKLRRFYATHGKHAGDGMVYYFFPQPDCNYVLNAIRCAYEMKETMRNISRAWQKRKNWMNELELNIGIDEGQEWFGTYQTPTHLEFTVLGDTINIAGRLSDFARSGSIFVTKNTLGRLTSKERSRVHYGIRRHSIDGTENLIPSTYSRISNLVDLQNPKYEKFRDIAVLPVTEVLDVEQPEVPVTKS